MISAFWEELFRLADQYKKEGKTLETRIVREIEEVLQRAYDRSLSMETPAASQTLSLPIQALV